MRTQVLVGLEKLCKQVGLPELNERAVRVAGEIEEGERDWPLSAREVIDALRGRRRKRQDRSQEEQEPSLTELEDECLQALHALGAIKEALRQKADEVADKIERGKGAASIKHALARLVRKGLVESRCGRRGGSWLTQSGAYRARHIK
jgi:hypothetical protein